MEITDHRSEVARLCQQIEAEYQAAQRALSEVTMIGRHTFITTRQENIGKCFETLSTLMTPEEASKVIAQALERGATQ